MVLSLVNIALNISTYSATRVVSLAIQDIIGNPIKHNISNTATIAHSIQNISPQLSSDGG